MGNETLNVSIFQLADNLGFILQGVLFVLGILLVEDLEKPTSLGVDRTERTIERLSGILNTNHVCFLSLSVSRYFYRYRKSDGIVLQIAVSGYLRLYVLRRVEEMTRSFGSQFGADLLEFHSDPF